MTDLYIVLSTYTAANGDITGDTWRHAATFDFNEARQAAVQALHHLTGREKSRALIWIERWALDLPEEMNAYLTPMEIVNSEAVADLFDGDPTEWREFFNGRTCPRDEMGNYIVDF